MWVVELRPPPSLVVLPARRRSRTGLRRLIPSFRQKGDLVKSGLNSLKPSWRTKRAGGLRRSSGYGPNNCEWNRSRAGEPSGNVFCKRKERGLKKKPGRERNTNVYWPKKEL